MKINDVLVEFASPGGGNGGNYLKALASAWYNGTFNTGDLHKGIKSQEDVERILERGIHCGDGKIRKYSIGYNANFDGVEIQSDDHYEYADYDDAGRDIDSRTGKPWGPYDVVEFHDRELDESVSEGSKYKCSCHPGDADPDCPVHGLEPMEVGDALDVKKGVAEMDGDGAGRDGSNRKSHSTYGSRDKHTVRNGPDVHLDPKSMMTSKQMQDRALDTLKKTMSKPENMAVLKRLKTKEGVAEGNKKPEQPEADYGDDYQDMVKRVKKLAGLGPLKTVYDPNKRVYKNIPTAVQPKK